MQPGKEICADLENKTPSPHQVTTPPAAQPAAQPDTKPEQTKNQLEQSSKRDERLAIIFINCSALLQVLNFSIIKHLTAVQKEETIIVDNLDLCQTRTLVLCFTSLAVCLFKGKLKEVKDALWSPRKYWLLVRCILGAVAYYGMTSSLERLPVSFTMILVNTTPFWATIVAYFIMGDRVSVADIVCMTGALGGIIVLAQGKQMNDASSEVAEIDRSQILIGLCWGVVGSVLLAFVVVITRKVKEMFPSLILFYYAVVSLLVYTPMMVYQFKEMGSEEEEYLSSHGCDTSLPRFFCYTKYQWLLLLIISLINTFGQTLQTMAFQKSHSGFITMLKSVSVLYSFIADIFYFKASFDALSLIGAITTFIFLTSSIYLRVKAKKTAVEAAPKEPTSEEKKESSSTGPSPHRESAENEKS